MKPGNNNNRNRGHNKNRNNNYRNNNNRQNNVPSKNQVLESSGPSGKIRGNLMQLIEKYLAAGKDAASQSDIVLAETCYQYADHYTRLFNVANAYDNQRREEQMRQQQNNRQNNDEETSEVSDENEPSTCEDNTEDTNKDTSSEKEDKTNDISQIPFLNTEIELSTEEEKPEVKKRKIHRPRKKVVVETKEETTSDVSA